MLNVPQESQPAHPEPAGGLPPRWSRLRYVRCEACGAKALVAASQCPQCSHPLELRNSRGQPVRLAYCAACDLFYPRKRGACIWCGTKTPSFRVAPFVFGGAGVVVVLGMAWGVWQLRPTPVVDPGPAAQVSAGEPVVVPSYRADSSGPSIVAAAEPNDSSSREATARDTAADAATRDSASAVSALGVSPVAEVTTRDSAVAGSASPVKPIDPTSDATTTGHTPPHARVETPVRPREPAASRTRELRATAPRSPRNIRWVTTTVRGWVTVRADASIHARIVSAVGPDTRIQVGESRSGWLRVRARGISGWVEGGRLYADRAFAR